MVATEAVAGSTIVNQMLQSSTHDPQVQESNINAEQATIDDTSDVQIQSMSTTEEQVNNDRKLDDQASNNLIHGQDLDDKTASDCPEWSMFPELHDAVQARLQEHALTWTFYDGIDQKRSKLWDTLIMGEFNCVNKECEQTGWPSAKVATAIQGYGDNKYNAIVYAQRCRTCKKVGKMSLNEQTYIDRVVRRLLLWSGIEQDKPKDIRETPPHDRRLCEACRRRCCRAGNYGRSAVQRLAYRSRPL